MYTNEEAIKIIWTRLHTYAEDSLGDLIGHGCNEDPEIDSTYADEWADICEAMAHISKQLNVPT